MYLDTASYSVDSTPKVTNVYPSNGFETFGHFDHIRTSTGNTHGNIPYNPLNHNMYGLASVPMSHQYSMQGHWKPSHVDNSRSDVAPKDEGIAVNSSDTPLTVDQSSAVTTSEQAPVSPSSSDNGSQSSATSSKKKARTVFTSNQLSELQATFVRKKYLSTEERMRLSEEIGISHTKIKTWFQNRRMKWKRENHCSVPGLITIAQDCPRQPHPSSILEKSLIAIPSTPVHHFQAPSSHIQMPPSVTRLTSPANVGCMPLSQPMYNQTHSNSFPHSMNNSMLGHHSMSPTQHPYNGHDLRFPPMSFSNTPTYDSSCLGYSTCSRYSYQAPPTYSNKESLLMVASHTQPFLTP